MERRRAPAPKDTIAPLRRRHFKEQVRREVRATQRLDSSLLKAATAAGRAVGSLPTPPDLARALDAIGGALAGLPAAQAQAMAEEAKAAARVGYRQARAEIAALERHHGDAETADKIARARIRPPAVTTSAGGGTFPDLFAGLRDRVQEAAAKAVGAAAEAHGEVAAQAIWGQRWQTSRIAVTEVAGALNAGHEAAIADLAAAFPDLGLAKAWSAVFDSRTSRRCRGLHGQTRPPGDEFVARDGWRGLSPPAHPRCRSRVVATSERWGSDQISARSAREDDPMKHKKRAMETRACQITDLKVNGEEGTFEGYASTFGGVDSYGDTIAPGAFTKTIQRWASQRKMLPVLWQHNSAEPIGVCDPADMVEDEKGLSVKGRLTKGVQRADEARALMIDGALGGLSIGFNIVEKGTPPKGSKAKRLLKEVDLWEFSPVTWPANTDAVITGVKGDGEARAADFDTVLDLSERWADLCRRRWKIDDALGDANRLAVQDETMDRAAKITAIDTNLGQYHDAVLAWFTDYLDLLEEEAASNAKGAVGPLEIRRGLPDATRAGKRLSAKTYACIEKAMAAAMTGHGHLKSLLDEGDDEEEMEPEEGARGPGPGQRRNLPAPVASDPAGGDDGEALLILMRASMAARPA